MESLKHNTVLIEADQGEASAETQNQEDLEERLHGKEEPSDEEVLKEAKLLEYTEMSGVVLEETGHSKDDEIETLCHFWHSRGQESQGHSHHQDSREHEIIFTAEHCECEEVKTKSQEDRGSFTETQSNEGTFDQVIDHKTILEPEYLEIHSPETCEDIPSVQKLDDEDSLVSRCDSISRFSRFCRHPAVIVLVIVTLAFVFHPKFLNIRINLSRPEEPVPMNFVSNFYLWTRLNKYEPERIVVGLPHKLKDTNFFSKKTYIIIHGFTRNGLDKWVVNMKDALLWRENCNVISVDWQAGSITVGYYVIQARAPAVGWDVAQMISFLKDNAKLEYSQFHIIGHSLGAHIAGFAGKALDGNVSRITGLDPAGLAYNGVSAANRLASTDAAFVDVIHTHGCVNSIINQFTDCYGTYENMGDADFWPSGGGSQPACGMDGDGKNVVREGSNCHHGMAYAYYTSSILFPDTGTRFLARPCSSWSDYVNNSCFCGTSQYMGYNVNPSLHGVFYLDTSATRPYGLLDPQCFSGRYSWLKITGIPVCFILSLKWFVDITIEVLSLCLRKKLKKTVYSSLYSKFPCLLLIPPSGERLQVPLPQVQRIEEVKEDMSAEVCLVLQRPTVDPGDSSQVEGQNNGKGDEKGLCGESTEMLHCERVENIGEHDNGH